MGIFCIKRLHRNDSKNKIQKLNGNGISKFFLKMIGPSNQSKHINNPENNVWINKNIFDFLLVRVILHGVENPSKNETAEKIFFK